MKNTLTHSMSMCHMTVKNRKIETLKAASYPNNELPVVFFEMVAVTRTEPPKELGKIRSFARP